MKEQNLLELINNVNKEVKDLGYAIDTINKYNKVWNDLKEYCLTNNYDNYSIEIGEKYLIEECNIYNNYNNKKYKNIYRSVMILNSYLRYNKIYTKYFIKYHKLNSSHEELMDEYMKYCEISKYNSFKTLSYKKYAITRFFFLLEEENIEDLNQIDIKIIEKYLQTLFNVSHNSLKLYLYTLRDFFSYLYENNKVNKNLKYIIPSVKFNKNPIIPSVWKNENIEKLIKSIDTVNPIGKRDYAIILLVAKLGIRVMDLKHLTIDNIDWKKKEINFIASKNKRNINLPLPNDVGWAIIDYLKNGRPVCEAKEIFIRHVKPIGPFAENDALSGIIKKYIKLGNIDLDKETQKKGMHSLRHSLATNLLKNNIPIDSISFILGQDNRSSVSYYLKIDTDKLQECCGDDDYYGI